MAGSLDIGMLAGADREGQSNDVRAGPPLAYIQTTLGAYNESRINSLLTGIKKSRTLTII
ncbi:hypothetical protein [Bradyrhizobium sp. WSM3983]|uniref:hypothetical protein n=1 Tax=Bradyrhizobium sp. WSM3983 TaxID=1038867 RepID=UPI0012EB70BA|nr:hypothetical protein [Bradyrhizobium sp. WSM3983]